MATTFDAEMKEKQQMRSPTIDRPLRFAEVADALDVSLTTFRGIARRREIAVTMVGGRPRILPRHLEEYLERQTREAVAAP